jgi:phosphatidylserine/phosphatidylglycerophosphate/cardiolipin synthase-like enzyme
VGHLHQTVALEGGYETLRELGSSSQTAFSMDGMSEAMRRCGIENPTAAIGEFVASNLLSRAGDRLALTTWGIRTSLLLKALNGGDLRDIYRRLSHLDSTLRTYELVREGMTETFLRNLNERPGFARLYICSPWISFNRRQEELLTNAIHLVERARGVSPEILIITRPAEKSGEAVPASVARLHELGATIFLNRRLHTKLYIREPDISGGYCMAIVGSQNLTKSRHLELGVRINSDGEMVDRLIAYFLELTNHSHEIQGS